MLKSMVGKRGWVKRLLTVSAFSVGLVMTTAGGAAPLNAEQAERLRIQEHLASVEAQLRRAPVDALAPAARAARSRLLDELRRYRQAGVFPRNTGHPFERRPYFIDHEARACAVGALIQRSGEEALAARIDREFHTEYVPNMPDAELLAWAQAHGFTVAELASIQPSYCNCDGWGGGFGPEDGAGGAAPDGADFYQPVCGANGLTYWNQCIAELCGDVQVVANGTCDQEPPCELCGTGDRYAVVAECRLEGICNGIDSQPHVVPVNPLVAERWLELQGRDCQRPDYDLNNWGPDEFWQPSVWARDQWQCSSESVVEGGAGGETFGEGGKEPASGGAAPSSAGGPSGGTSKGGATSSPEAEGARESSSCRAGSSAPRNGWESLGLIAAVLALLRRRRGAAVERESFRDPTANISSGR